MKFKATNEPFEKTLPKLIRDKIPEIMKKKNLNPVVSICENDSDYLEFVLKKIVEETMEVQSYKNEDNLVEELADVKELTRAIMKLKNISEEDVEKVRVLKNKTNGAFKKRYILEKK